MTGKKLSPLWLAVFLSVLFWAAAPSTGACQRLPSDPASLFESWIEKINDLRERSEKYSEQLKQSAKELRELRAELMRLQELLKISQRDLLISREYSESLSRSLDQLKASLAAAYANYLRNTIIAGVAAFVVGIAAGASVTAYLLLQSNRVTLQAYDYGIPRISIERAPADQYAAQ